MRQQQEAEAAKAREQQAQASARAALPPTAIPTAMAAPTAVPAPVATRVPVAAVPPPTAAPPPRPRPRRCRSRPASAPACARAIWWTSPRSTCNPQSPRRGQGDGAARRDAHEVPVSGYVILKVLVNEKGGVDDVQVLRPFPPAAPRDRRGVHRGRQAEPLPAGDEGRPAGQDLDHGDQTDRDPARPVGSSFTRVFGPPPWRAFPFALSPCAPHVSRWRPDPGGRAAATARWSGCSRGTRSLVRYCLSLERNTCIASCGGSAASARRSR